MNETFMKTLELLPLVPYLGLSFGIQKKISLEKKIIDAATF